ncbi:pitrilysin family protein [Filibacter tadaridae]|uniref:Zinc protease AlbF n=1 Tax=Filibacter tadaridae TaxID=2483811 RepID=A0A3P5XHT7_9BACL|nr:pitrilysin family protein [Filibacter tadaridae]VDC29704.1 Putative zinc protease AlbF [Filibacter tadaridae]
MINKYICNNGVRIVHERMPHVRSLALGIWVEAGSSDEHPQEAGIAHFIEHMLFKGTAARSARTIAEEFDRLGGDINAFTSKEVTCIYTTVLGHHAPLALKILADMFFNSLFDDNEMSKEKSVILDEIASVEDTPDDDVDERLWQVMYPSHPIGKPVLGNEQTIETFDKEMIAAFMERLYTPDRLVISIAGDYDDSLIGLIEELFGTFKSENIQRQLADSKHPEFQSGVTMKTKDIEQAHICIGFPALTVKDARVHNLILLDSILGGAMSSRLFQEVREERGLAYSIYSYYSSYRTAGSFIIYGGSAPENAPELIDTIDRVIDSILESGITKSELHNAKEQLKGGFLLGLESSESRMHRNGKNELMLNEHKTIDGVVALIDAVDAMGIHELAKEILSGQRAISIIAPEKAINQMDF